jgi:hypothetical protein
MMKWKNLPGGTMEMDQKRALKLALDALSREKKAIAFDANMVRTMLTGSPVMQQRARRYDKLNAAMIEIRKMVDELGSSSG